MDEQNQLRKVNIDGRTVYMFPSAISLVQEGQRVIPINSQARWKTDTSAWDNALANDSTDYHFGKYTHHAINTKNYWPLAEDADVSAFPQIVGYEPVLAPSVRGNAGKITRGAFYVKYPGSDVPQRVPLTYDSNYHVNHGAGWSKFLQNLNQSIWRGTFDTSLLDDVDFQTQLAGEYMRHHPGSVKGLPLKPADQRSSRAYQFDQYARRGYAQNSAAPQFNWVRSSEDALGIGKLVNTGLTYYESDKDPVAVTPGAKARTQFKKGGKMKLIPRRQRGGLIQKAQEGIPGGFRPWFAYGDEPYEAIYRAQHDPAFKYFADQQYDGKSIGIPTGAYIDENGDYTVTTEPLKDMATVTAPMPMEHWSPSDYVVNTLDAINTVGQRIASDESDSAAEARDKDISVQVASAILPTALLGKTGKLAGKLVRSGKAFKSLEQTIGESNRAIQAMKRNMRRASKQALPKAAYDDMGDIASIKSDYTYDARGLDATYNYRPEFDQAYLDSDPRVREYLNDFESASWNQRVQPIIDKRIHFHIPGGDDSFSKSRYYISENNQPFIDAATKRHSDYLTNSIIGGKHPRSSHGEFDPNVKGIIDGTIPVPSKPSYSSGPQTASTYMLGQGNPQLVGLKQKMMMQEMQANDALARQEFLETLRGERLRNNLRNIPVGVAGAAMGGTGAWALYEAMRPKRTSVIESHTETPDSIGYKVPDAQEIYNKYMKK